MADARIHIEGRHRFRVCRGTATAPALESIAAGSESRRPSSGRSKSRRTLAARATLRRDVRRAAHATASRSRRHSDGAAARALAAGSHDDGHDCRRPKDAYVVDDFALPVDNPWRRNVRPGDIQFLKDGTGVLVTLDGDVWMVRGLHQAWRARSPGGASRPACTSR